MANFVLSALEGNIVHLVNKCNLLEQVVGALGIELSKHLNIPCGFLFSYVSLSALLKAKDIADGRSRNC